MLRIGAEVHNPDENEVGPRYITFRLFDDDGNEVQVANVTVIGVGGGETIYASTGTHWEGPLPATMTVESASATFKHRSVATGKLPVTHSDLTPDGGEQTVPGTVENTSDLVAERVRIHCVYFEGDQLSGGNTLDIGALESKRSQEWEVIVPGNVDAARCSAIDRPDDLGR